MPACPKENDLNDGQLGGASDFLFDGILRQVFVAGREGFEVVLH